MNKTKTNVCTLKDCKEIKPVYFTNHAEFKLAMYYFYFVMNETCISSSKKFTLAYLYYRVQYNYAHEIAHVKIAKNHKKFSRFGLRIDETRRRGFGLDSVEFSFFVVFMSYIGHSSGRRFKDKNYYKECIMAYYIVIAPAVYCTGESAVLSEIDIELRNKYSNHFVKRFGCDIERYLELTCD